VPITFTTLLSHHLILYLLLHGLDKISGDVTSDQAKRLLQRSTFPTFGNFGVGIVRSRTQTMEFFLLLKKITQGYSGLTKVMGISVQFKSHILNR
jgi:hypothetical protein